MKTSDLKTPKELEQFLLGNQHVAFAVLRSEDLIIPETMTQDFGFTDVLGKQAHSRLRNCFFSAAVKSKDKSEPGIIKSSFLSTKQPPAKRPVG